MWKIAGEIPEPFQDLWIELAVVLLDKGVVIVSQKIFGGIDNPVKGNLGSRNIRNPLIALRRFE